MMSDLIPMKNQHLPGLYIVSTPIGNIKDITLRAIEVLKMVDQIYCEDTRVSQRLLHHYSISTPLKTYHEHNAAQKRPRILQHLEQGKSVALISDAGTPLISDPGFKLVREVQSRNLLVVSVPGPCSPIAALSICGLRTDQFTFAGFIPHKRGEKKTFFEGLRPNQNTLIFFDSNRRVFETLNVMKEVFPNNKIALCRELTKLYEEVKVEKTIEDLLTTLSQHSPLKGEIILLVENDVTQEPSPQLLREKLEVLLQYMPVKVATNYLSKETKVSNKKLYDLALEIKEKKTLD